MATLCDRCEIPGVVYQQTNGNGNVVIVERCPKCGGNTRPGKPFLPKSEYPNFAELPVFADLLEFSEPCAVKDCNRMDTEYHHFAPKHLFGFECEDWPGAYLCKYHHSMWHKLTQTGSYYKRPARAKVAA